MAVLASSYKPGTGRHYLSRDQTPLPHLCSRYLFCIWSTVSVLPSLNPVFFHRFLSGSQMFVTESGGNLHRIQDRIADVQHTIDLSAPMRLASPGVSPNPRTQTTRKKAGNR